MMMATLGLRLNTQEDPNCCSAFGVSRRLLQNIDTWENEVFAIQSKVVDMATAVTQRIAKEQTYGAGQCLPVK